MANPVNNQYNLLVDCSVNDGGPPAVVQPTPGVAPERLYSVINRLAYATYDNIFNIIETHAKTNFSTYTPGERVLADAVNRPSLPNRLERMLPLPAQLQDSEPELAQALKSYVIFCGITAYVDNPQHIPGVRGYPHLYSSILAKRVAAVFDYKAPLEAPLSYGSGRSDGYLVSLSQHLARSSFTPSSVRTLISEELIRIPNNLKDIPSTAQRILDKELVSISCDLGSIGGHVVNLIFYRNYYYICNSERPELAPIFIDKKLTNTWSYPISKHISKETLEKVLQIITELDVKPVLKVHEYLETTIPQLLYPNRKPFPGLHNVVSQPAQNSPACYYLSFRLGVLLSTRALDGSKEASKAMGNALLEYELGFFNDYLTHTPPENPAYDPNLIQHVFNKIQLLIKNKPSAFRHNALITLLTPLPILHKKVADLGFLDYRTHWNVVPYEFPASAASAAKPAEEETKE